MKIGRLLVGLAVTGVVGFAAVQAATESSHPDNVEYAFTQAGQHPENLLKSEIDASHKTLDIAIYSLTKYDIVDAILAAKKRGVNVRIITDKIEAKSKSQAQELAILKKNGIPIKINKHSGLMHLKVTIVDGKVVTTGSYNYSQSASTTNDEVLVVLHDSKMASDFDQQFQRMWDDTKGFTNY